MDPTDKGVGRGGVVFPLRFREGLLPFGPTPSQSFSFDSGFRSARYDIRRGLRKPSKVFFHVVLFIKITRGREGR